MHLAPFKSNDGDDCVPSGAYCVMVDMTRSLPWRPDNQHESVCIKWWNRAGSTIEPLPPAEEMEALMVAHAVIQARMVQLDAVMSGTQRPG